MYHSQSGSFSTRSSTKNPLASSKNRNNAAESLERNAQYASNNPMATTHRSSIHASEKASTLGSPRTGPDSTAPYFGHEGGGKSLNTKRSNVTIKSTLDSNYQSEPFGRKSHESHLSHLEAPTSRRGMEFSSRGIHSSQHLTRSIDMNQTTKDIKQSNSYINAMKALQTRVKELEDERKRERLEWEERHREEIQTAQRNFEEERKSFHDLENSLKNRIKLSEDELSERDRAFEDIKNENERLRKAGYELETERVAEIQKITAEKKRLKDQYMELEEKYHELLRINEDLKGRMMRADFAVQDKDNELHDLREKLDSSEREKAAMNLQAEQRFKDLVSRQKQEEERRKGLETEHNEEIRRRTTREENIEREGTKIRSRLRDLEEHNEILEKKLRDRETEFADKASYILKLKDEVEGLYRELQKSKEANQRTHLYAQDMAEMNQRLINGFIEKGQAVPRDYDVNFISSPRVNTKEYNMSRIDSSPQADILGGRRRTREDIESVSDNRSKYRSPREDKRGWQIGSPGQKSVVVREFDYSTKGPKLNDEDLFMSERRAPVEEKKSPRGILLNSGSKSMNAGGRRGTENSGTKVKFVTKRDDRRENAVDKLELEGVLKDIIVIQKDMLEWNREYQGLINETMSLPKESNEYRNRKKRMEELANLLQEKNFHLLNLKKKEEELIIKLKDS